MALAQDPYPFDKDDFRTGSIIGYMSPSKDLRHRVKSFVRGLEKETSELDQTIAEAERDTGKECAMAELWTRREELVDSIELYRHLLVRLVVADVPDDIWRLIFPQCLPITPPSVVGTEGAHFIFPYYEIRQPPWTFTYVCQQWRAVATSLPSLWNHIAVSNALPFGGEHLLQLCIDRSQDMPLSIYAPLLSKDDYDYYYLEPTFTNLFKAAHRFELLELSFASRDTPNLFTLCNTPTPAFPLLEHFVSSSVSTIPPWIAHAIFTAPKLQAIDVYSFPRSILGSIAAMPNVTSLKLGDDENEYDARSAASVVALMPNLKTLICHIDSDFSRKGLNSDDTLPITLNQLTTLKISGKESLSSSADSIFTSRLMLPALRHISVHVYDNLGGLRTMTALITRSECDIETCFLSLSKMWENDTFPDFLKAAASLRSLTLDMLRSGSERLLEIQNGAPAPPVCRYLRDLILVYYSSDLIFHRDKAFVISSLADIVRSRSFDTPSTSRLHSLVVTIVFDDQHSEKKILFNMGDRAQMGEFLLWKRLCDHFTRSVLLDLWDACRPKIGYGAGESGVKLTFVVEELLGRRWVASLVSEHHPVTHPPQFFSFD